MAQRLLSPERQAELLARYPHEGNRALAEAFGLSAQQVAHIAYENRAHKTPAMRSALSGGKTVQNGPSAMQQVLAAVQAAGKAGMSRREALAALPGLHVGSAMDSLASRGHLHSAGPRGATRWYEHAADARAHAAACGAAQRASRSRRAVARRERQGLPVATSSAPAVPAQPLPTAAARAPITSRLFTDLGAGHYADAEPCAWVAAITRRA